uniref:Uncharacterized protein n=1 Tax=Arundo donax TaxID=35708 RepID=A0A0A9ERQ7_ARUDO
MPSKQPLNDISNNKAVQRKEKRLQQKH